MARCEDCQAAVVFLRKPDGGWLPPVEPILDFAYNDHFIATLDGVAAPVPQIYQRHECMSWEERQLKRIEKDRERRALIEADRERRKAEQERLDEERREYIAEQERERLAAVAAREEKRRLRDEQRRVEREIERKRLEALARKEFEQERDYAIRRFPKRLLPYPCRECEALADEACRTEFFNTHARAHNWWKTVGCSARYQDAPPDARLNLRLAEHWGEDYDHLSSRVGFVKGSTPETVGPWPPSLNSAGAYDMVRFLRASYIDVWEPERRWLTDDEQRTLGDWLHEFGEDLFGEQD